MAVLIQLLIIRFRKWGIGRSDLFSIFSFLFHMKHLRLFTCLKIRQFPLFVKEFLKKKGYLLGIFFGSSMMRVSNDRRKRE